MGLRENHEATIDRYLSTTTLVGLEARGDDRLLGRSSGVVGHRLWASKVWAWLRSARIFEFTPKAFVNVYHSVDVYTTEKVCRLKYAPAGDSSVIARAKKQRKIYDERIIAAGREMPFPEPLPFDATYLGFGPGVILKPSQVLGRISPGTREDKVRGDLAKQISSGRLAKLTGFLVVESGDDSIVIQFMTVEGPNQEPTIYYDVVYARPVQAPPGRARVAVWTNPWTMDPWLVNFFIALINGHKTFILEEERSFTVRQKFGKARKKSRLKKLVPPPYYVVTLQDQVIREKADSWTRDRARREIDWQHRWDVRAHERCYIRKGTLPIDPTLYEKLRKRGYRVYTNGKMGAEDAMRLMGRSIARGPKEWLAIKSVQVDQSIKGPVWAPYIPAVRR